MMTDLIDLQRRARLIDCEVVTKEYLKDTQRTFHLLMKAENSLRELAALRILAEKPGLRGWLVRRWIARIQIALDYFAAGA